MFELKILDKSRKCFDAQKSSALKLINSSAIVFSMEKEEKSCDEDAFRKIFKYFKQKQPPPDLSRVIDFQDESSFGKYVSLVLLFSSLLWLKFVY